MNADDLSETYRKMARDALKQAERAVSPNVRSRFMLMANQWNRRACELEQAKGGGSSPTTDPSSGQAQRAPPPRA